MPRPSHACARRGAPRCARPRARRAAVVPLPPARRSPAAAAGASHRARGHRRPLAHGAAIPPRRRAPGAGRRGYRRRVHRRAHPAPARPTFGSRPTPSAGSWARAPGSRPTVTSAATCSIRSVPTACGPTASCSARPSLGPFALVSRLARGAPDHRRSRVARPPRPGSGLAYGRGVPERAVQVRQRLLRADGPQLGTGRHRGYRPQRLRLQRHRARLRDRSGRGAAGRAGPLARGRPRQHRRAHPPLLFRPPARRPGQRPAAARALGDDRARRGRPGVRRALPQPAQPPPPGQPVRPRRRRQRALRRGWPLSRGQGHHGRGPDRHRRPPVREHDRSGSLPQSLGLHPRGPRAPRRRGSPGGHCTPRRRVSPSERSTRSRT